MSIPSIISIEFPLEVDTYIGYASMAMGIGLCAGPLLGAVLYAVLDYVNCFYVFTGYIFSVGVLAVMMIPSRVNYSGVGRSSTDVG